MCCSCGGADSRARHCTGETNGPSLKWQMPPNCHCEERSDVAISGRHSQIVQAAVKTYRPIASVAALTERLVQGYSTAQGHWCTARHPDVSLRGAKRRGNLAVPGRIVGKLSAKTQLPSRDRTPRALPRASRSGRHVGLRPPRNDKLGSLTHSPEIPPDLQLPKAVTDRRYRRNRFLRFYRHLVRTGSAFPRLPRRPAASSQ